MKRQYQSSTTLSTSKKTQNQRKQGFGSAFLLPFLHKLNGFLLCIVTKLRKLSENSEKYLDFIPLRGYNIDTSEVIPHRKEVNKMTGQEIWHKVNHENNGEIGYLLLNLRERWSYEKDYEDINDYLAVIKEKLPEAYKISKRPFGVVCKCDDCDIFIKVVVNGGYMNLAACRV